MHTYERTPVRKHISLSKTLPHSNWVNLQSYKTSQERASLWSLKYLKDQTYTTARLTGIQRSLTVHRYQMKSIFQQEKVEAGVKPVKMGRSAGVGNIPAELEEEIRCVFDDN